MYKISQQGIDLIKDFESLSLKPYKDDYKGTTRIEYSIGYGHQIRPGEEFLMNGITEETASDLLDGDIEATEALINARIKPNILNQNQVDALASLVYNYPNAIVGGTIDQKLNAYQNSAALQTWSEYIYAEGKQNEALKKRRAIEIELFKKKSSNNIAVVVSLLMFLFVTALIYAYKQANKIK